MGGIIPGRNPSAPQETIAPALFLVPASLDLNQSPKRSAELITKRCIGRGLSTDASVGLPWHKEEQGATPVGECIEPVTAIVSLACRITTESDQTRFSFREHGGRRCTSGMGLERESPQPCQSFRGFPHPQLRH